MVIVFVNSKGGVGKTTLAVHLAAWMYLHGLHVCIVDADPQQHAALWLSTACPEVDVHVILDAERLYSEAKNLSETYDVVVIDSPGILNEATGAALSIADAAIIPTGTSGLELDGVDRTADTIKEIQDLRNEFPDYIDGPVPASERRRYLAPNTVVIPVKADQRRLALRDLRELAEDLEFGTTENMLPTTDKYKAITPRSKRRGREERPGRLMWQMGKSKDVREAALNIDAVFKEVFPEVASENTNLVADLVTRNKPKGRKSTAASRDTFRNQGQ